MGRPSENLVGQATVDLRKILFYKKTICGSNVVLRTVCSLYFNEIQRLSSAYDILPHPSCMSASCMRSSRQRQSSLSRTKKAVIPFYSTETDVTDLPISRLGNFTRRQNLGGSAHSANEILTAFVSKLRLSSGGQCGQHFERVLLNNKP